VPNPNATGFDTLAKTAGKTTIQTWKAFVVAGQDGHTYPFTMVGNDVRTPVEAREDQDPRDPGVVHISQHRRRLRPNRRKPRVRRDTERAGGNSQRADLQADQLHGRGTEVGKTQFGDALQREELWQWAKPDGTNPGYHVYLNGSSPTSVSVTATGYPESQAGTCAGLGEIDIGHWSALLSNSIFPALAADGVSPTTFTIFLFKNVVLFDGNTGQCCLVGYRSILDNPAFGNALQSYARRRLRHHRPVSPASQTAACSAARVGAWMNNPFYINPTPAWGHIGTIKRCQTLLDADGPFFGSDYALDVSGVDYHVQELPFWGWFFDYDVGINGVYSTLGTLTSASTLC